MLAGLGAAGVLTLGAGLFAWLAGGEAEPVGASTAIEINLADQVHTASADTLHEDPFAHGEGEDVSLPGVTDSEEALSHHPEPVAPEPVQVTRHAPYPGMYEPGPGGPLPIIASDGRRPDQVYASEFDGVQDAPTIALIIGGLGQNEAVTRRAIRSLPAEVTLSFAAHVDNLQDWINEARQDGHEVLIELPMEPFDYPNNDPGPLTLLVDAAQEENDRRLLSLLSKGAGNVGVMNYQGARLSSDQDMLEHIFAGLEARGLLMIHDGAGRRNTVMAAANAAHARLTMADRVIDGNPSPDSIDERLFELEALSLQNGNALGAGFHFPVTIETVAVWAEDLAARGYQLAPVSFVNTLRNGPPQAHHAADSHDEHASSTDHQDDTSHSSGQGR